MGNSCRYRKIGDSFFNLIENKKTNIRFCFTCNKSFAETGCYKHIKSNNHLQKAGEISKCEIHK